MNNGLSPENILKNLQILFEESSPWIDRGKIDNRLTEYFTNGFSSYLVPEAKMEPNYPIIIKNKEFSLRLLLSIPGKKIAIEYEEGFDYDKNWEKYRDSHILETKQVDAIYRFRGNDLDLFINDCIYFIYYFNRRLKLFNDRYEINFRRLISEDLNAYLEENDFKLPNSLAIDHRIEKNMYGQFATRKTIIKRKLLVKDMVAK